MYTVNIKQISKIIDYWNFIFNILTTVYRFPNYYTKNEQKNPNNI